MLALVRSNYVAHPAFYSADQLTLTIENQLEQPEFDESRAQVHGLSTFKITGQSNEVTLLLIEAAYLVVYGNVDGGSERAVEFLRKVGRMAVYPYFRAHVSMTSAEGQLNIPMLPAVTIATFETGGISITWTRGTESAAD